MDSTIPAPRHPTIDDLLDLPAVGQVALSPDGALAVFVLGPASGQAGEIVPSALYAVAAEGGAPRQLSPAGVADRQPRWSPDGSVLAFTSVRPHGDEDLAPAQVYVLARSGGEARRVGALEGVVRDLAWTPDGTALIVLMTEVPDARQRERDLLRGGAIDVEQRPLFSRLWRLDARTGALRALTPPGLQVWEFGLTPDGLGAALVASDLPYEWSWYQSRLTMVEFEGMRVRTLHATPRQLAHPRVGPDGRSVAAITSTWSDRGVIGGDLLLVSTDSGEAVSLTEGAPLSVSYCEWEQAGSLLCCGYAGLRTAIWRLQPSGERATLWEGDAAFGERFQPRFSRAGARLAVLRNDAHEPPNLWLADCAGERLTGWSRLTDLHPAAREWALGEVRGISWRAPDGLEIEGLLALPHGHRAGDLLPLVTLVHGGPTFAFTHTFALEIWARLLLARGIAVLLPNPRGSTGRGLAFAEANMGDMGGGDWLDIVSGVEHVVGLGIADQGCLGIGGFSYGGFMAAWAVTQTDRFKAAVVYGGIADWRSFHGAGPVPAWDALAYGPLGAPADPYDPAGPHARFSPVARSAGVRTPTLILHGEGDGAQGYQLYRALRDRGTPVELTIYPREGHGVGERAHLRDLELRAADWFERHLGTV